MIKTIEVYLITGFLGSGKTSCLNHITQNIFPNIKTVILMNEFGSVGIDGALLQTGGLNILEINKGSIFCACAKTDFIKALAEIAVRLRPDVLLIEATGVANPSDIRRDLRLPLFKGAFNFQKQLCLVDCLNFPQEFELFAAAEYQIRDADICLFNKCDLAGKEAVAQAQSLVRQHNASAQFVETSQGRVDFAGLLPAGLERKGAFPMEQDPAPQDLNAVMRGMLMDLSLSLNPPDDLVSAVYKWRGGNRAAFDAVLAALPPEIVRAKALLQFNDGALARFDRIMERHTLEPYTAPTGANAPGAALYNHIVLLAKPGVINAFAGQAAQNPALTLVAE